MLRTAIRHYPLPNWVPEVGTIVQLLPVSTENIAYFQTSSYRAKVISVETDKENPGLIPFFIVTLEGSDCKIYMKAELPYATLLGNRTEQVHVAF